MSAHLVRLDPGLTGSITSTLLESVDKENKKEKGFGGFLQAIPWPWHVGLGLAAYFILHALAGREIPPADQTPVEIALYTHRVVWRTMASIFQYLLPATFGLLAILSLRRAGEKGRRNLEEKP